MAQEEQDVKEISEVVTDSDSSTEGNDQDFYSDIPEPQAEAQPTETEEQPEVEPESESKKSASNRIRELNERAKRAEHERDSLAKQFEQLSAISQLPQYDWGQQQAQYENGEITAEELEARAVQKALTLTQLEMQRQQHVQRVQSEANEATKEYPQLDPDSDSYDPELSQAVAEASLAYIRQYPTKSLKSFVSGLMKPYRNSVAKEVGNLADTVTKQAAEKALRPTSSPKGEKKFEDLSLEEMEARLGKVY